MGELNRVFRFWRERKEVGNLVMASKIPISQWTAAQRTALVRRIQTQLLDLSIGSTDDALARRLWAFCHELEEFIPQEAHVQPLVEE